MKMVYFFCPIPEGNITRKLSGAPRKDTAIVPDGGFTVLRFHADNPGWWLFHCHLEFHVEVDIALLFFYSSLGLFYLWERL